MYGRGPIENYRDRKNAAYVGKYQSAVNDMKESYARSQTMGGRCDTRWLTLTNKAGKGIKITAADTFVSVLCTIRIRTCLKSSTVMPCLIFIVRRWC